MSNDFNIECVNASFSYTLSRIVFLNWETSAFGVSKRSSKFDRQREANIGARLKQVRQMLSASQAAFAGLLGLTRDQLASIEVGRTPLRYDTAWRVRDRFGISLLWLCGDEMAEMLSAGDRLPPPGTTGLSPRCLLSEVYDVQVVQPHNAAVEAALRQPLPNAATSSEAAGAMFEAIGYNGQREFVAMMIRALANLWVASVPDDHVLEFGDNLVKFVDKYQRSLQNQPASLIEDRVRALTVQELRKLVESKLHDQGLGKIDLTSGSPQKMVAADMALWSNLRRELESLLRQRGMKSALARRLGVTRAAVSAWFKPKGSSAPQGETMLKLQQWVAETKASRPPSTVASGPVSKDQTPSRSRRKKAKPTK